MNNDKKIEKKIRIDKEASIYLDIMKTELGGTYSSVVSDAIIFYYKNRKNTELEKNNIEQNLEDLKKICLSSRTRQEKELSDITKYLSALWLGLRIKDLPTSEPTNAALYDFQKALANENNENKYSD